MGGTLQLEHRGCDYNFFILDKNKSPPDSKITS
jgi:hypothetical protein